MSKSTSNWVIQCMNKINMPKGTALDLACAKGRNTNFLAKKGFKVLAVDIDEKNFEYFSGKKIEKMIKDVELIENWPLVDYKFDIIVVTNFLKREIFPMLLASLKLGGYLIYETFSAGQEKIGKPTNPNYILEPKELIHLCSDMKLLVYEEIYSFNLHKPYIKQRILSKNVQ